MVRFQEGSFRGTSFIADVVVGVGSGTWTCGNAGLDMEIRGYCWAVSVTLLFIVSRSIFWASSRANVIEGVGSFGRAGRVTLIVKHVRSLSRTSCVALLVV